MKQFFCTICKNPVEVVGTEVQTGEFGPTLLVNLECPTCADHIGCTVEVPYVNTAQGIARKIMNDLVGADRKETVNDVVTVNSDVEHDVDTDVTIDGNVFNVNVNVTRFSIPS